MTPELTANLMCAHCGARPNLMDDLKDEFCYNCGLPSEWTDCGCATNLPPILIEVNADGTDNVKYSRKVERDIDQMVKELGVDADAALFYCHSCGMVFTAGDLLTIHKMEMKHR